MQEIGEEVLFDEVCLACMGELREISSQGGRLRAEAKFKEQNRMKLWNGRVNLVKQARQLMKTKAYSDAAVAYEKYIKSLEIVFDSRPGGLTPEHFKSKARQKELTVLASAYWDLVCIYDTSTRYGNRQLKAVDKLSEIARFTPIYPNIVRKAQGFLKKAKNPKTIRRLLRNSNAGRPRCFIATAVFADPYCPEVLQLCAFRDQVLTRSLAGRIVIQTYYLTSPPLAAAIDRLPPLQTLLRPALRTIAAQLWQRFDLKSEPDFQIVGYGEREEI